MITASEARELAGEACDLHNELLTLEQRIKEACAKCKFHVKAVSNSASDIRVRLEEAGYECEQDGRTLTIHWGAGYRKTEND